MSFNYFQSSGILSSATGSSWAGYSGHGAGRNNAEMENVPKIGPIPKGIYKIGAAYDDPHLGPCVMHLDPIDGTDTFGRSLFRLHGDNKAHDGSASEGCIIMPHDARETVSTSPDKILIVQ